MVKIYTILILLLALVVGIPFHSSQIIDAQETSPTPTLDETSDEESPEAETVISPPLETDNPINLTISPVTLNLEADPGEVIENQIRIRNNSAEVEILELSVGAFTADETGERPQLLDEVIDDEFLSWITFDQNMISIEPNEWATVNVTFSPPTTAALSYYYAIYLTRYQQLVPGNLETKINATPAILVLTTVDSPFAKKELQVEAFKPKYSFMEYLPQEFSVTIRNSGNVHLVPSGNIFIDGQGTKDISILSLNPSRSQILPQSSRTLTVQWSEGFPLNIEELENTEGLQFFGLAWDFSKVHQFRIGKYTANLLLVYDNGERDIPIESTLSFWIIPYRLILTSIAIPVIPALLVYFLMKWKMKRMRKQIEQSKYS